ncbi:MAG: dethiobiotin synthase [Planctomycetota bacterium]|jgi:dethiobiotin synthetase
MIPGRNRGVFVTGTDTGVGKTFVAAALAGAMAEAGADVGVMKPVASGCRRVRGVLVSDDARELARAAGLGEVPEDCCPVRYAAALGPSVAARREGRPVSLRRVMAAFRRLRRRHEFLIVEGVGGLAVPLTARTDVADMAAAMGLPLVVVAADRLGVLNHTLLTLELAARRNLRVAGVILNRPVARGDASRRGNAAELRRLGVPVVARVGYCRSPAGGARQLARLARRLRASSEEKPR